jgi:hypothetical protein
LVINPVTAERQRLGLPRKQFCLATGIRLDALYLVESGLARRPNEATLRFLEDMGVCRTELLERWAAYKESLQREVLESLR